ncbi:MAG: hypothetical protein PUB01_04420 [Desulfovibrionaceae bacterium]|nr:hypothetical protein [Desulfovibrionaceae bacterium]
MTGDSGGAVETLLMTLAVIAASLSAGCLVRRVVGESGEPALAALRRRMQLVALFGCMPLSAMLSLWGLPAPDVRLLALPALGVASWAAGGLFALLAARLLRLDRRQTGSMFCCGTFTNIGALGGLVSVLYLGEGSIALVALYRLCEDFYYFGVGLPVARRYGAEAATPETGRRKGRVLAGGPVLAGVLAALALGVLLNWQGVPRPAWCGPLASGTMLLATVLFLTAVGMSLRLSRVGLYTRQWMSVAAIKFCCTPAVVCSLGWWAGLGAVDGGLPLKTVLIVSCMPVAMNALVPPSLYHLDLDMANTCWLCTTAALIVILPLLLLALPCI